MLKLTLAKILARVYLKGMEQTKQITLTAEELIVLRLIVGASLNETLSLLSPADISVRIRQDILNKVSDQ